MSNQSASLNIDSFRSCIKNKIIQMNKQIENIDDLERNRKQYDFQTNEKSEMNIGNINEYYEDAYNKHLSNNSDNVTNTTIINSKLFNDDSIIKSDSDLYSAFEMLYISIISHSPLYMFQLTDYIH